jgi:hypothetical protein
LPDAASQRKVSWPELYGHVGSLLRILSWRQFEKCRLALAEASSPIGYISIALLVLETILELAHATTFTVEIGRWLALVALCFLALLLVHKRGESQELKRQAMFLTGAHFAVTALDKLTFPRDSTPEQGSVVLRDCVEEILQVVLDTFQLRGSLNSNVMLAEPNGQLAIKYVRVSPGTKYYVNWKPQPGEGGAGLCFSELGIVYFPNYRWRHGVLIKTGEDAKTLSLSLYFDLYHHVPEEYEANYTAILSAPVAAYH